MAKKNIKEAPIDYGDYPERIDPRLERKLGSPENIYAQNPAFRKGVQDVERLTGKRFKEVVDRVRSAFNQPNVSSQQVQQSIIQTMMSLVPQIMQIESRYKTKLKRLAVKLALDETGSDKTWYKIEAYLNELPIDVSNFRINPEEKKQKPPKKEQPEIPSFDIDVPTDEEQRELEIHKRHLINAIIQGEAKKGHYSFMRPDVLDYIESNINPTLANLYRQVMAANDLLYWTMEQMVEMMSQTGNGVAGKVELQDNDDDDEEEGEEEDRPDTKIVANGMIFPILVHEIIKGLEEAPARAQFQDMDKETAMDIMGQTDTLVNEPMQLRIGPAVVEAIKFALPDDMFEPENRALHPWFKQILYSLPAKEFLELIGMAISDEDALNRKARTKFEEIMRDAIVKKKEYDEHGQEEDYEDDDESVF